MRRITVLVVDDNVMFLRAALLTLIAQPRLQVIDTVVSGLEALDAVKAQAPDMVLLDFNMPQMNGIETALCLRATGYAGKIVLMSLSDEREIRDSQGDISVDAFLNKQDFGEGIAAVVELFFPRTPSSDC